MNKKLVAAANSTIADAFPSDNRPPLAVSKKGAARELSVCVRTVDRLIAEKELSAFRVGKRVLVRYASLQQFVRRGHVATTTALAPPMLTQ